MPAMSSTRPRVLSAAPVTPETAPSMVPEMLEMEPEISSIPWCRDALLLHVRGAGTLRWERRLLPARADPYETPAGNTRPYKITVGNLEDCYSL